jgi:hypothetical protein
MGPPPLLTWHYSDTQFPQVAPNSCHDLKLVADVLATARALRPPSQAHAMELDARVRAAALAAPPAPPSEPPLTLRAPPRTRARTH